MITPRSQRDHWDRLADLDPDVAVIDPADHRGDKSRYIRAIRDQAFQDGLRRHGVTQGTILDFGSGTGSAALPLLESGHRIIGLDISAALLQHARRRSSGKPALWVQIDGTRLPVAAHSIDAAVCYVVLTYVTDPAVVVQLLQAIRHALKLGSPLLLIEQARRTNELVENGQKYQRRISDWIHLLQTAGYQPATFRILRHGHFPTTPLIRYGLLPVRLWPQLRRLEARTGRAIGVLPGDYAEVLFEAHA